MMTKKDTAFDRGDGYVIDAMSVSGHILFDAFGRSIESYYPTVEDMGTLALFNPTLDTKAPPTRTAYDVLDRKTLTTLPDRLSVLRNVYGFKIDREGIERFEENNMRILVREVKFNVRFCSMLERMNL